MKKLVVWMVLLSKAPVSLSNSEMKRIYRLMAPREDGSHLVPEAVVKMWKDTANGGREEVKKLWLNVEGNKDWISTVEVAFSPDFFPTCPFLTRSCPLLAPAQDLFIQKCRRHVESIEENDLWVNGKFMSEKTMRDDGYEEPIACTNIIYTSPSP